MIDQGDVVVIFLHLFQQRLDELEQVVDLLEFAPAVLVEFAFPGQDMQLFQQLD